MIDYDNFFSLVDVDEKEIASAKEYIKLRGLEEHVRMAKYLSSFIVDRKPTYKEVATAFRYDKRIRRILYKYIGFLEESYRAYICNNFKSAVELGINTDKPLYQYISFSLFSTLINVIWSLNNERKSTIFGDKLILKKNLDALITLRNVIGHNRTVINYRNFREVTLDTGESGSSLLMNIRNMLLFLPAEIRNECIKELNEASRSGTKKIRNQVDWNLNAMLIFKL